MHGNGLDRYSSTMYTGVWVEGVEVATNHIINYLFSNSTATCTRELTKGGVEIATNHLIYYQFDNVNIAEIKDKRVQVLMGMGGVWTSTYASCT